MSFTHHAFTEREAAEYRERKLSDLRPPRTLFGMQAHYPCLATAVVLVLAMLVLVASILPPWWVLAILAAPAGVLGVAGLRLQLEADNYERDHRLVDGELRVASNPELAWINDKCEQFPEIQVEVRRWIAENRAVRERDVRAIRAYLFNAEPRLERQALLAKLAGKTDVVGSADRINDNLT